MLKSGTRPALLANRLPQPIRTYSDENLMPSSERKYQTDEKTGVRVTARLIGSKEMAGEDVIAVGDYVSEAVWSLGKWGVQNAVLRELVRQNLPSVETEIELRGTSSTWHLETYQRRLVKWRPRSVTHCMVVVPLKRTSMVNRDETVLEHTQIQGC